MVSAVGEHSFLICFKSYTSNHSEVVIPVVQDRVVSVATDVVVSYSTSPFNDCIVRYTKEQVFVRVVFQ